MEPRISTLVLDKTDGKFPLASERTRGIGAGWGGPGDSADPSRAKPVAVEKGVAYASMTQQVADFDASVINWINADLVTHICPRV